nr:dienelactone hydrolase family protein [Pigmentibacter ruber]
MSNSPNGDRMSIQSNSINAKGKKTIQLNSPLKVVSNIRGDDIKNIIICLHGFGDNAANFSSLANEINVQNVLWLFPQGPKNYPMGFDGAQWFPLFNDPTEERRNSEELILQLIYEAIEVCKLDFSKVFLLGFSQGAALAIHCGLKTKEKLAGILALSGFIFQAHAIKNAYAGKVIETPMLVLHGNQDQVIFPVTYYDMLDSLKDLGVKRLRNKIYSNMGHTISSEEIKDITKFIEENR